MTEGRYKKCSMIQIKLFRRKLQTINGTSPGRYYKTLGTVFESPDIYWYRKRTRELQLYAVIRSYVTLGEGCSGGTLAGKLPCPSPHLPLINYKYAFFSWTVFKEFSHTCLKFLVNATMGNGMPQPIVSLSIVTIHTHYSAGHLDFYT